MKKIYSLSLALFWMAFGTVKAQYTVLHNFGSFPGDGLIPGRSLTLSGKVLYGMTSYGGTHKYGCIFSIDINGNGYKDLHDFDSTYGAHPTGSLTLSGSRLYGMTKSGGTNNQGCIFSLDTNGNGYKDLIDFNGSNGCLPQGSLILSGNKLYGMTLRGGTNQLGVVFSLDTNGLNYNILLDFDGAVKKGESPVGSLILSGKVLYGMTLAGGGGGGNIFSIDTNGNSYKQLHCFGSVPFGEKAPYGSLALSGGKLYGMTSEPSGNIFSIDTNGNNYTDMFDFNGGSGCCPHGSLTLSGNVLYGIAGEIFSIDTNGNAFKQMHVFDNPNGPVPEGDLTLSGNTLYGMVACGGTDSAGVIFKIDTSANVMGVNRLNASEAQVILFPNPNDGKFTVSLQGVSDYTYITIYNILGEQVYHSSPNATNPQVDLGNKADGLYLYRVLTENGNLVSEGKFIIQK